jgi:hypothetical protein
VRCGRVLWSVGRRGSTAVLRETERERERESWLARGWEGDTVSLH